MFSMNREEVPTLAITKSTYVDWNMNFGPIEISWRRCGIIPNDNDGVQIREVSQFFQRYHGNGRSVVAKHDNWRRTKETSRQQIR